eukprot:scaffold15289_cov248-Alexandrium_tamarense.AAC.3
MTWYQTKALSRHQRTICLSSQPVYDDLAFTYVSIVGTMSISTSTDRANHDDCSQLDAPIPIRRYYDCEGRVCFVASSVALPAQRRTGGGKVPSITNPYQGDVKATGDST